MHHTFWDRYVPGGGKRGDLMVSAISGSVRAQVRRDGLASIQGVGVCVCVCVGGGGGGEEILLVALFYRNRDNSNSGLMSHLVGIKA